MFECVVNVSEGRDLTWLDKVTSTLRGVADVHRDADHNRSVVTLVGEGGDLVDTVLSLARVVVRDLDVGRHEGVHPRIGTLDVVPFVPLGSATLDQAVDLRDLAANRLAHELDLPVFLYGPLLDGTVRSLPEVRRTAFTTLVPDLGPVDPHRRAGGVAIGARQVMVAWNLWLEGVSLADARRIAASIRSESVRALGMEVEGAVQVSCNLLDPAVVTPEGVADAVTERLGGEGRAVRSELVGLAPRATLAAVSPARWAELDLSEERTIEAACGRLGLTIS